MMSPRSRYDFRVPALDLPADRTSPARARRFVSEVMESWGLDGEAVDDGELLVSELVTNAVLHARSASRVEVVRVRRAVRVRVCDRSPARPHVRDYGPQAVTGRGLLLVERLSRRWGIEVDGDGKCVWFELNPRPAGAEKSVAAKASRRR